MSCNFLFRLKSLGACSKLSSPQDLVSRVATSVGDALWRLVLGGVEPSASCGQEEEEEEEKGEICANSEPSAGPKDTRLGLQKPPLRRDFEGMVTSVLEDRLLVNGNLVVDLQLLKAAVECGAVLKGTATRQTQFDNWTAIEVEVVASGESTVQELWDDVVPERLQERLRPKSAAPPGKLVAMVTALSNGRGELNNEFTFSTGVCEPGFRARKGDWVLAQLAAPEGGEGPLQVARISVLRRAAFRGRVTGLSREAGFINRQVRDLNVSHALFTCSVATDFFVFNSRKLRFFRFGSCGETVSAASTHGWATSLPGGAWSPCRPAIARSVL